MGAMQRRQGPNAWGLFKVMQPCNTPQCNIFIFHAILAALTTARVATPAHSVQTQRLGFKT
jgi:hypothetical protein